jgi:hypothetical protein
MTGRKRRGGIATPAGLPDIRASLPHVPDIRDQFHPVHDIRKGRKGR